VNFIGTAELFDPTQRQSRWSQKLDLSQAIEATLENVVPSENELRSTVPKTIFAICENKFSTKC